jgi:hypothetical protein
VFLVFDFSASCTFFNYVIDLRLLTYRHVSISFFSGRVYPRSPKFSAAPFLLKCLLPHFILFKNLFPWRMFYPSNYTLFHLYVGNSITQAILVKSVVTLLDKGFLVWYPRISYHNLIWVIIADALFTLMKV